MHEAAIAQSILDIAEREARKHHSAKINKIKLTLGEFRGVVKEALEFSFAAMKAGSLAADAELEIETVRLRVKCGNCEDVQVAMSDFTLLCPNCGELLTITAGREMQVDYVDLD